MTIYVYFCFHFGQNFVHFDWLKESGWKDIWQKNKSGAFSYGLWLLWDNNEILYVALGSPALATRWRCWLDTRFLTTKMDLLAAVVNQIPWGQGSFDGCSTLQLTMRQKPSNSAFKGLKLTKERSFTAWFCILSPVLMTSQTLLLWWCHHRTLTKSLTKSDKFQQVRLF